MKRAMCDRSRSSAGGSHSSVPSSMPADPIHRPWARLSAPPPANAPMQRPAGPDGRRARARVPQPRARAAAALGAPVHDRRGQHVRARVPGRGDKLWLFARAELDDTELLVDEAGEAHAGYERAARGRITALGCDPTLEVGQLTWKSDSPRRWTP